MKLFEITGRQDARIVVSVPHTGAAIPGEVEKKLAVPVEEVRGEVDEYADVLARTAEPFATVVVARISRAVIDLNRSGTVAELDLDHDPERERERLVRLYDDRGRCLWKAPVGQPPITREELEARIRKYHDPYHAVLRNCLERAGRPCALVDVHTMSDPAFEIVIGDFRGRSAGAGFVARRLRPFFSARGYRVGYAGPGNADQRGRPVPPSAVRYSGGFITARYGAPSSGRYAFQIEVNREACARGLERMRVDFRNFFAHLEALVKALSVQAAGGRQGRVAPLGENSILLKDM